MSSIIASTYELLQQIGSGGGGIVYLARHLRLGKLVVMKADKRRLTAKPESLRREVDSLKNLSHTYIPQVYDFIVEEDQVYTVMDFIEGESLDKPLKRGERFSQPDVIKWACQLLEALHYLHTRPPHGILHSDIKPANVMITPQGDVCLIDFNIALALGAEGAVKVGFSRGYASPEHYSSQMAAAGQTQMDSDNTTTPTRSWIHTVVDSASSQKTGNSKTMLLDVRSDIYSLGATLYHLLTGQKPAVDAKDVVPINTKEVSPAVAAIIQKAMSPDPAQRYQTAEQMLYAFKHLHDTDRRTRRLKARSRVMACVLSAVFLAGGLTCFVGMQRMQSLQNAYLLAEEAHNLSDAGEKDKAIRTALQALPEEETWLIPGPTAQAQKALADALGAYDLSSGLKLTHTLNLTSNVQKLEISPSGLYGAAACLGELTLFHTHTGEIIAVLPMVESALADFRFMDDQTLIYAAEEGITLYDVASNKALWVGEKTGKITVSANGESIAAANMDGTHAVVYTPSGKVRYQAEFGDRKLDMVDNTRAADPGGVVFALNGEGNYLAVSFSDGTVVLFDIVTDTKNVFFEDSSYSYFEGGFSGRHFVLSAKKDDRSVMGVFDMETLEMTGGFELTSKIGIQADETGVYMSNEYVVVELDPVTGEQRERAFVNSEVRDFHCTPDHTLVMTQDQGCYVFNRAAVEEKLEVLADPGNKYAAMSGDVVILGGLDSNRVHLMQFEAYDDAQIFAYDPRYPHSEARVNEEKTAAMLFSYLGFRIVAPDGTILAEKELPNPEEIYDQQYYRREDSAVLEVTYNDGTVITYSAETGEELDRTQRENVVDETLLEVFETDLFRIESPIDGAPIVFDKQTGAQLCTLERDDYLVYAPQVGDLVLLHYVTDDGDVYGVLMNKRGELLAEIPNVSDVLGNALIINDQSGFLRECPIYSLEELKDMAHEVLQNSQ